MTKSMQLLEEALSELQDLAVEARSKNSLIYEGMGYTPLQVILLEAAEEEKDTGGAGDSKASFLNRAADSIKKLIRAADVAIEEMETMRDQMQEFGFGATVDALNRAIKDLKKKRPGKGFLGKIGTGAGMAVRALFGKEDDPAEAVAEIVTDANTFQKVFGDVVKAVFKTLEKVEIAKVVDETTGEEGEVSDEEKKEYIEQLKTKMKDTTLNDMVNNPDWEEFRAGSGFDESKIKDAVAGAIKPAEGMFSGLRSLGSSLGIGLGGDVPFKKYYGMNSGQALIDDLMLLTPTQLSSFMKKGAKTGDDSDMKDVQAGLQGLAAAKEEAPKDAQPGAAKGTAGAPGATGTGAASGGGDKVDTILTTVGIKNPGAAKKKFVDLMGIQLGETLNFTLYDLLQEKVVRYAAVVDALEGHLPEDETEQAVAVKKLADEMKAELGAEYDIVGIPDTGKQERDALRAEIQALRDTLEGLPPDEREDAAQKVADKLAQQGMDSETATAAVTADTSVDAVINTIDDDEADAITDAGGIDVDVGTGGEGATGKENLIATAVAEAASGAVEEVLSVGLEKVVNKVPFGSLASDVLGLLGADPEDAVAKAVMTPLKGAIEEMLGGLKVVDDIDKAAQVILGDDAKTLLILAREDPDSVTGFVKKLDKVQLVKGLVKAADTGLLGDSASGAIQKVRDTKAGNIPVGDMAMDWLTDKKTKYKKPTKDLLKRGKAAGVQWKETDTPKNYAKRVRRAEKKTVKKKDVKEESVKYALGAMRRHLLETTLDFRYVSNLSSPQVISEFYSRGGTNFLIKEKLKMQSEKNTSLIRWTRLAGIEK